ncbi:50S ribosomal protein L29 [Chloroflexota bacterium]
MKVKEIRALSADGLVKQLEAVQKEFFDLRFRLATKQLVNHREVRSTRKKIARLKTIMRERELSLR